MFIPWFQFLSDDEQLLIITPTQRRVANGPGMVLTPPFSQVTRRKALLLDPTEAVRVRDTQSGELQTLSGPQRSFLGAYEELDTALTVIPLTSTQYVRLIDRRTGVIRVERGAQQVIPGPTEDVLEMPREGVNIDAMTAVLVRDTRDGSLELITTPQVFVPTPFQTIVEVRQRILLADHEAVVVKDRSGAFQIRRGVDAERAFFLAPYNELVQFRWSSGLHKDRRELRLTHLDLRPKFMWYEFEARTHDNVELLIGITFFWQIVDVERMLRVTDDTPGDLCSHARSDILQAVSQVPLERFLAAFNEVIGAAVLGEADPFYAERGVVLHAVEVRSVACKDAATQQVLQEIIQETTNRLNRLQQQASANEVRLHEMRGAIEAEVLRGELMEVRRTVEQAEARIAGSSEGERVRALLAGLGDDLTAEAKLAIFQTLRKQDALTALSKGNARLYFTPEDVDLRITG